jgi:GntR family transcriptional regulator
MALERIDNAPLAERARSLILNAILAKDFDERLPSEDVLAEMLNVSRTTIRTALHSLEQEGVITRRRAVGTTINPHIRPSALALQRMVGFDTLLREQGYDVRVESTWERGTTPKDFADAFAVPRGEEVLLTDKRYYADDGLAIYIRDAMPWPELKDPDKLDAQIPPSMFEFSRRYCRRAVDHAVVEILPVVRRKDTTHLDVAAGKPFTRLHERHYTAGGEAIAMSIIDVDDAYVRFEVFRRE